MAFGFSKPDSRKSLSPVSKMSASALMAARQLLCFGGALLTGLPVFFLIRPTGNMSAAIAAMIAAMLPLFFLAMYEKDGQPLEVVLKHYIDARFRRPKVRPYRTDNAYAKLEKQYDARMEVKRIVDGSNQRDKKAVRKKG